MTTANAALTRARRLTEQTLNKELRILESEISQLDAAAEQLRTALQSLRGGASSGRGKSNNSASVARPSKGKRIRRTPEQLRNVGASIVEFISSKGAEGARGIEIRKLHKKIGPDIKGFVAKFGGQKLKTSGVKSSMRYYVR